jgi:hypothetical protein
MNAEQAEIQADTLQARLRDMVLRAYIAELGRQVILSYTNILLHCATKLFQQLYNHCVMLQYVC